jgi:phosphodiesterase/alkaline phosphatase D-like protein
VNFELFTFDMSRTNSSPSGSHVPLRDRLEDLPLLLAGPILRRTESDSVTVWVALKAPREVTLKVYATDAEGSILTTLLLEGTQFTLPFGQHLHIVAVTAKPIHHTRLESGQIYAYDLSFGQLESNLTQALTSKLCPHVSLSYFEHQRPTFALPPEDLNDLRLAHGSCRKFHGGGADALPILDDSIGYYAQKPNSRLHQLFFTGDQIYGDDVADPLLWVATEVGNTLLGWEEHLPLSCSPTPSRDHKPSGFKPGQRTRVAQEDCSFTAMLVNQPEKSKSHLLSLGEYFASYLLVWSPILWPEYLPFGQDICSDPKQAKSWDKEAKHVHDCISQLGKVRRVLANVPTYMIFDDHDVTDDWYLNRAWCTNVLSKPLGRRVIQNAMLAYAVFQAWGNTPNRFATGCSGEKLLKAAIRWSASAGTDEYAEEEIKTLLGIPALEPETGLPKLKLDEDVLILDREDVDGMMPVEWHYTLRSHKHEVLVLDTRTWRGYPLGDEGAIAPPMLLSPTAFKTQIEHPLELTDSLKQAGESDIQVTFVILPTNLVSLQIIDIVQRSELEKGNVFGSDVGDGWNLNEVALSRLLSTLFQRRRMVIILSGDIHYGATIRLSYWFNPSQKPMLNTQQTRLKQDNWQQSSNAQVSIPNNARVLTQLTASAFKNAELKTQVAHTKIKSLAPELPQDWIGWHQPPQLVEIQISPDWTRVIDMEVPAKGPVVRQITGVRGYWDMVWDIAPKNTQSMPDWHYHIDWIKRQKSRLAPWIAPSISSVDSTTRRWLGALGNLVSWLWRNRWLQEGEEVIGLNNFAIVSLKWSTSDAKIDAVIQDTYWQPPWQPDSVVYSRYVVPMCVEKPLNFQVSKWVNTKENSQL